jgi:hypothetical protein
MTPSRLGRALSDADTRWRWLVLAVVGSLLVASSAALFIGEDGQKRPAARPYADAPYYYSWAPTLYLDHDVDFTNQYRVTMNWYRFGATPTKKPANVFGAGPGILSAPVFLPAHAAAVVSGERRDGFSPIEQIAVMWLSVLLSVTALVFPYRIAARRLDARGAGLAAAVLVFAAGPVVYYAVRQPGYAHPMATFFAAWLVDAWDASFDRRRTVRTWMLLGAAFGLAVLARPQLATWALLFVFAALDDVRRATPREPATLARIAGRWAAGALVAFVCIAPQLLAWKSLYGAYYVVPQGDGFMRWDEPAWSEVLWSSRNGLFPWAPLYALAALGMLVGIARAPRLFGALVLAVAAQVIVNGAAWDWWGGGAYGGRRFDSTYVAFALGLAVLLAPTRMMRIPAAVVGTVAALLALANLWLAGSYASPSARIYGGEPAARIIKQKVPGRLGRIAATASSWTNWPLRYQFAREYDRDTWAYDELVGVHFMGETFPGLNSIPPRNTDNRTIGQIEPKFRRGYEPAKDGWTIATGRACIFVGLNRTGGLEIGVPMSHASSTDEIVLTWNGHIVQRGPASVTRARFAFNTHDLERGINLLEVYAPPGTIAYGLELKALP